MWVWLQGLSQGQAAFLGSLTGASIGLVALLLGALFNAHLNRRRDDSLRRQDRRAVATALKAELAGLKETLVSNAEGLKDRPPQEVFLLPALAHSVRVLPHMLPKVGLLDPETIQSVIAAYVVVEQYFEKLLLLGGRLNERLTSQSGRRLVVLSADHAPQVIAMNTAISEVIEKAIAKLDASLQETARWQRAWRLMRTRG